MHLLVLAGGFGSRLKGVLHNTPKALAPINNKPFLELQLNHWINQGVSSFTFLLHYKSGQIINFLDAYKAIHKNGFTYNYVIEDKPLDTGGAILNAINTLDIKDDFMVTNADTWLESGFSIIGESTSPTILAVHLNDCSRYGTIKFDKNNNVLLFREKSNYSKAGFINAGLMKLSPEIFYNCKKENFSLERDIFPYLVDNKLLKVMPINTFFMDIGIPKDYKIFCEKHKY